MPEPTLAELLGATIILIGLGLSGWALVDDLWDLVHVYRFGEIGGPRWVAAMEHLISNLTFLGAWTCILGVLSIAIYLPARREPVADSLSAIAGWLRFGATLLFLTGQVNRRIGRMKLRALPIESWERMLTAMFDGMTFDQRSWLTQRILQLQTAGREMGHAVRNDAQLPLAVLDELARDPTQTPERRAEAAEAVAALDRMLRHTTALHAAIKQEPAP